MTKLKRSVMLMISVILIFAAAACGSSKTSDDTVNVRFSEVIRSIFYAPHYVAKSKGFFFDQGLNVDMNTAQGSDKGAAALIAGTADISLVGPETSIYIYNQQGDKKLKVFHQLTVIDGSFLLSREKMENFKWSDLQGKTVIGWRPGSAPQMIMNSTLIKEGVTDVEVITNLAAPAMAGAFTMGQGDFIQVYEPIASSLVEEGIAHKVAAMGEAFGTFPETSYVATTDYIQKNPDVIQKFTKAVTKGTEWLNTASDEEIAAVLQPFFIGTPEAIIIQSVNNYKSQGAWPAVPELTEEQFVILQDVLVENGVLEAEKKITDRSEIVDMSFVTSNGRTE